MSLPPGFRFEIETPRPFQPARGYFRMEGWALLPKAAAPTRVRLRIAGATFQPEALIDRPDVAAAFPDDPHALQVGFRFICYLPFGFYVALFEVSDDGSTWHVIRRLAVPVSSHPLLGAFEKPIPGTFIDHPVRIEGWSFHPEFELTSLALRFGNIEVACDYGLERQDVTAIFPQHAAAARAGFITSENLPKGAGRLKLRTDTRCGRVYFLESQLSGKITTGTDHIGSPLSTVRPVIKLPPIARGGTARSAPAPRPGSRNILFVLYGDFTCNSALHVAALANELIDLGYDCVVAGPSHKETISRLPRAQFMALEFAEWASLPDYFVDGKGPTLIHAWTPRENVRRFVEQLREAYGVPVFVHLEDNERAILESELGRSSEELLQLPAAELDAAVPDHLSHPTHAAEFLGKAAGITTIVERLIEVVPEGVPTLTFWPAADRRIFFPREPDPALRRALGISEADTVLLYHGNVHAANAAEVGSLYAAVDRLNEAGRRTYLLRAGRDDAGLMEAYAASIAPYLLELGYVAPRFLAELMRLADYFVQPGLPGAFNDYRFPSKLPEFFSIGRPVILPRTNLGSALRHGIDAYVLPEATAESIAAAVLDLHGKPELKARLAAGALAFAEREFSWVVSAKRLLEFYHSHSALQMLPAPASE